MKVLLLFIKIYSVVIGWIIKLIIKNCKNIKIGSGVKFRGFAIMDVAAGGKLLVEDNVTLNSMNLDYHLNMYGPTKIFIEENAEVVIGKNSRLHGVCIHARIGIKIGRNCLIAANTNIVDCNGHDLSFHSPDVRLETRGTSSPIEIGDNVWIGAGVLILPGVKIGAGSVIAAGSIVTKSMPSMALVAGNPAKVIKTYPI